MEPGPTERHETDTAAAPTSADGPDVADNPGARRTPERGTTATGGDSGPPKPRTRRGWMSDSPLDGGSGWPTSAYAIIRRPEGYLSANGSSPAVGRHGTAPEPEAVPVPPVEEPSKIKLPRQKPWRLGRAGSNRHVAFDSTNAEPETVDDGYDETADETADETSEETSEVANDAVAMPPAARGTASVTTTGSLPVVVEPPEPPEPATDDDDGGTPRGLAIAGALIVLVALALVVFFAIRVNRTDTDQPASSAPTGTADVVEPESSTGVSFAPETTTTSATGDVLRAGSVRLSLGPDRADESFDFDSGIKGVSSAFAGTQQPDLDALTQGLWAAHGAHVAVWKKPGSPTAAGCRALPNGDWTSLITVEPGLNGPKVCVQTSEGRVAGFVARPIDIGPDGGVQTVYLDFTVWKKAGD